ncbi:MAG: DUF421 domain-containing protein [Firmicutes bacterium]|nr:DUF421 domain-containing protein [Bacillota bacterium]
MVSNIAKLVFLFLFIIIILRILGKSVLAQLAPHDLMTIFFIAYLAFQPIKIEGTSQAIVGIIVIAIVHVVIGKLSFIQKLNKLIIGEPTILIQHGKIIKSNLKSSRYSLGELISSIRTSGYHDIKNIEYAILEPNGELSILPKADIIPIKPKHLNIKAEREGLPVAVVIEGKIQYKNLKFINKSEEWLLKKLKSHGYNNIDDIFYATVKDTDYTLTTDTWKKHYK